MSKLGKGIWIPVPEGLDAETCQSFFAATVGALRKVGEELAVLSADDPLRRDWMLMTDSARLVDLDAMTKIHYSSLGMKGNRIAVESYNAALKDIAGDA